MHGGYRSIRFGKGPNDDLIDTPAVISEILSISKAIYMFIGEPVWTGAFRRKSSFVVWDNGAYGLGLLQPNNSWWSWLWNNGEGTEKCKTWVAFLYSHSCRPAVVVSLLYSHCRKVTVEQLLDFHSDDGEPVDMASVVQSDYL